MKKRIGTKIIFLLGVLSLIFMLFCIANVAALSEIRTRSVDITNIYLELEKEEGDLSSQLQELWFYKDLESIQGIGIETLEEKMTVVQERMAVIEELCRQTGDKTLIDSYEFYQA